MEPRTRRTRPNPDAVVAEDTLRVTSSYMGTEKHRAEVLQVRKFAVEPAYVRVNAGSTKNMGNYESLRVDVSISVPCYAEEIDKVVPLVADKVAQFLEDELKNYE